MASKGQKFLKHAENIKEEIIKKYLEGISGYYLAKQYYIPVGTIKTWGRKYRKQGSLENDVYHNRGRKKERASTIEDYKERYEILKKYQAFLKAQREKK
jgi:transposase